MKNKALELLLENCRGKFSIEGKNGVRYCNALNPKLKNSILCKYSGKPEKSGNKIYYTCRCDYLGHFLME